MNRLTSSAAERVLIWLAVATSCGVTAYRLVVAYREPAGLAGDSWWGLTVEDWVTNGLILWSLAFLLAATFLWRMAHGRNRELARVINSVSPDVLLVVTPDCRITLCNPAVRAMFGRDPDELIGCHTEVLYGDRRKPGAAREVHDALETIGFHVGSATGHRPGGETFSLEIVTGNLEGRAGAVVLIRDITERRRAEAELRRAHEALEGGYQRLRDVESLRDNLTHMVVHDIKHAVSGVSASLDLLKRAAGTRLDAASLGYLDSAQGFVGDVMEMVRSLLDISRLESGQMPLDRIPCDLLALAREAGSLVQTVAFQKKVRVDLPGETVTAPVDRDVLLRVFANLLGNAVRYAPEGSTVEVRVSRLATAIRVEVVDDGPGVPAAYHSKIFEKFGRVEMRREGADHSTGLGLTFCKLAVEAHGGQIGVTSPAPQSARGGGSLFWFTLPV